MAKKPTISSITSGYTSTTTLNANFEALRDGFDNTLSLDGSTPNAMGADFDMNGYRVLNAGQIDTDALYLNGVAVRSATDVEFQTTYLTASYTGNGSTTAYALTANPQSEGNVSIYIDGVYQNKDTFSLSGTTITFSEAPPLNSAIEIVYPSNTDTVNGSIASAITYNQGSTGAQDRTVKAKLQEFVSVKDFGAVGDGVTDDSVAIENAVSAVGNAGGGVVYFPAGIYRSPFLTSNQMTFDNITFQGDGRPDFNSGFTGLEGGTVIQGTIAFKSNNTTFRDLGVDVGSAVCAAINGGTAMEGLVSGTGDGSYLHNNRIENVSVICKPASSVHAILFEAQEEGFINNVATLYANAGIVLKGRRVTIDGVYARSHDNYSLLIKSDAAGGTCDNINVSNVYIDSVVNPALLVPGVAANWDSTGFVLLPTSSGGTDYPVTNVNATNIIVRNNKTGINFDTTSGGYVENVNISNFTIENCFFAGIYAEVNSSEIKFSDGQVHTTDYGVLNEASDAVYENITSSVSGHNCFANSGSNVIFENCTADAPYSINYFGFSNTAGSSIVRTPNYKNITTNKVGTTGGSLTIEDIADNNAFIVSVRDYLQKQLISNIEAITGTGSVVAAWFAPSDANATTMADYSTYGTHTATRRNGTTLVAENFKSTFAQGIGNSIILDANAVWDTPDAADLSFGNGSTDSAFSVMCVCKPLTSFVADIAAKLDTTTGSEQREWTLLLGSSAGLFFTMYDNSTGGTISRRYNSSLSPYNDLWNIYTGTYNGSATAAGIKVYIGATELTDSDVSSGSYTAMENTTAKVGSYNLDTAGATANELYARMALTLIFNVELSASDVAAVRLLLNTYFDL